MTYKTDQGTDKAILEVGWEMQGTIFKPTLALHPHPVYIFDQIVLKSGPVGGTLCGDKADAPSSV